MAILDESKKKDPYQKKGSGSPTPGSGVVPGNVGPVDPPPSTWTPTAGDIAVLRGLLGGGSQNLSVNVSGGGGGGGGANKKQQARNLAAELSDRAKQLGLTLTDKDIAALAKKAVDEKWSEAMINDELLISTDWQKVTGGDLTAGVDLLQGMGASYLVKVGEAQAQEWALRMARGELTQQGVASMLQEQSRARFSWMAPLIDQGVKPSDYFAPLQSVIADTLEVSPATIDLLDPAWMQLVEIPDPKTGGTRAATMNEAMLSARKRPEWANTRGAQEMTAQIGQQLAGIFGRAA